MNVVSFLDFTTTYSWISILSKNMYLLSKKILHMSLVWKWKRRRNVELMKNNILSTTLAQFIVFHSFIFTFTFIFLWNQPLGVTLYGTCTLFCSHRKKTVVPIKLNKFSSIAFEFVWSSNSKSVEFALRHRFR